MTEDPIGQTAPSMPRWQGTGHALEAPWVGGLERAIAAATLLGACLVWGRQPDVPVLALMTWAAAFGAGPGRSLASAREPWIGHILTSWTLKIALLATIGWAAQMMAFFDQRVLASWVIAAPLAQIASRASWQHLVGRIRQAQPLPSAVVVGANPLGRALARSLPNQDLQPCRLLGFFDDRARSRLGGVSEAGVLGAVGDVVEFARHHHVQRVYIALPMASQARILALLKGLGDTTASVYFVPDVFMLDLIGARIDTVAGLPVLAVCDSPLQGSQQWIKRASDLAIASAAIVLTAPLMLAIAAAIALTSPGPVIFRQRRYGLDGAEIQVWKFRSMTVAEDGEQVRQAQRNDTRVTTVGRFIRRTSLDELPQLFNVLQGTMSVVGPRPHAVAHNQMYRRLIQGYMLRHKVKPGITGLAQVHGARGETDTLEKMQNRIRYDLEYLRNWSIGLDLRILVRTVWVVLRDPNAY